MKSDNGQSLNSPRIWDKIWIDEKDDAGFWQWVQSEEAGVRGSKIISYIEQYLGKISGIKIIEVGSGEGCYSFIFAKRGAVVTLLDYSQEALLRSHKHFESPGLSASFVCADGLNLSPNLQGKFDVAMSFGTVEHYRYPERFLMAQAHFNLIKPGGIVIISGPNRRFFLHEALKFYLQKKGKWQLGYERAFSQQELLRLANQMGLENVKIYSSAFISDLLRYINIFKGSHLLRRFCSAPPKGGYIPNLASLFDDLLLGADIFLIGRKPL
jgi:2-polyprenyl-3-methyl-5-hydroxy-6-metoxy-1,4-benzoquinol methylase